MTETFIDMKNLSFKIYIFIYLEFVIITSENTFFTHNRKRIVFVEGL